MVNIRNDSAAVAEAHRQAEIIAARLEGGAIDNRTPGTAIGSLSERGEVAKSIIADALLDIWQREIDVAKEAA
jgi:hypothetical protein